jgi:hypothetical protein
VEALYEQKNNGYKDEDIGIIICSQESDLSLLVRYVRLFQKLNQVFSEKKIECSVLFESESLSQEKTVVIVCG